MATAVIMPRQGNTVESCLITSWKKKVGDQISEGEVLCEIETDKAIMEVESTASGTVLALFFKEGEEVPVLTNIAAIGEQGEDTETLRPNGSTEGQTPAEPSLVSSEKTISSPATAISSDSMSETGNGTRIGISPRARTLAEEHEIDAASLQGSGPGGRVIERDIHIALTTKPLMTPLAKSMLAHGGYQAPVQGSGTSGRIMAGDLAAVATPNTDLAEDEVQVIPVKGIRKVIATRMLESLQTTAQLTLNASADATALLAYRQRLKSSAEELDLRQVTINDLILLTVSRILPQFPDLNALFKDDTIYQYKHVHLGVAVDTPRGLMVPTIRNANTLSLKQIAQESRRLAAACLDGTISPDELSGGTFTITNLGNLGIESFTPVLNPPQVGILGVGNINLKPVEVEGEVEFIKHIGLSLTINHQVVDGAPAARFLQAVTQGLAEVELLLAL